MRGAPMVLAVVMAALHAPASTAVAQVPVAVDWSGVKDADIQRCGLSRLRAATIERLVADGYAMVERVDDASGIHVELASSAAGLQIDVTGAGATRRASLAMGDDCDATFALDVISRVAELVNEVARSRPPEPLPVERPSNPEVAAAPPAAETAPVEPAPRSSVQAGIDLTMRVNEAPGWLLGGGLGVRARLPAALELGARAELLGYGALGVTILEGFLGLTASYQPSLPGLGACLELGPILHHATSDARSVTELDALLAVGAQLSLGHFLAQLLAYGRLGSFEHRVGAKVAYDTGHVGLIFRLGAQLSGS